LSGWPSDTDSEVNKEYSDMFSASIIMMDKRQTGIKKPA